MKKKLKRFGTTKAKRLLVTTDLSEVGDAVLAYAPALLKAGGEIRIFHSIPIVHRAGYRSEAPDPLATHQLQEDARRRLKKMASGMRAQFRVVSSESATAAILREASSWKADLVLMSSHGHGGLDKLFFGSTVQKVLAKYRGAVIVIKPAF